MHRAALTIPCADEREADTLVRSVQVEADEGPDGTRTTLRADGATVAVEMKAADLSGLRAALHSVLRLLDAARRVA